MEKFWFNFCKKNDVILKVDKINTLEILEVADFCALRANFCAVRCG